MNGKRSNFSNFIDSQKNPSLHNQPMTNAMLNRLSLLSSILSFLRKYYNQHISWSTLSISLPYPEFPHLTINAFDYMAEIMDTNVHAHRQGYEKKAFLLVRFIDVARRNNFVATAKPPHDISLISPTVSTISLHSL